MKTANDLQVETVTSNPQGEQKAPRKHWSDGLLLGSLGVLAFSGTLPATRAAVSFFSPLILTCARIEIAAVLAVLTLLITRQWRFPDKRHLPGLLWMGFGVAVGYPFFVAVALQQVPAAHGAVVIGLTPVVTALIAVVRAGERPSPAFWIACLIGVGTVLFFAIHQGGGHITLADGWLVLAMLSLGMAYVEGGRVARELGGTTTLCWAMILLAPIIAFPLGFALWQHEWVAIPVSAWAGFWYASIVSMFLGSVLWYQALAVGGIARIGQLNLTQPLLTLLWSALLLGERVTITAVICATVIIGAMVTCLGSRTPSTPN